MRLKNLATIAGIIGIGFVMSACQIHKQVAVKKQDRAEVSAPKLSLESLDLRVADIERRMAAARAARAKVIAR